LVLEEKFFSGPLPHPEILRSYNDVIPGSGERIMKVFEKQQEHRMKGGKEYIH